MYYLQGISTWLFYSSFSTGLIFSSYTEAGITCFQTDIFLFLAKLIGCLLEHFGNVKRSACNSGFIHLVLLLRKFLTGVLINFIFGENPFSDDHFAFINGIYGDW
jgi:hypothetical protein